MERQRSRIFQNFDGFEMRMIFPHAFANDHSFIEMVPSKEIVIPYRNDAFTTPHTNLISGQRKRHLQLFRNLKRQRSRPSFDWIHFFRQTFCNHSSSIGKRIFPMSDVRSNDVVSNTNGFFGRRKSETQSRNVMRHVHNF